jgi:sn-glycerol 3-phosphate transport system permease protein
MIASRRGLWLARCILGVTALLVLLPLVYQTGMSFKTESSIFVNPLSPFPSLFTAENYLEVLRDMPLARYLLNSLLFAGGVTLGQLAIALPAAFAFSYYRFPLRDFLLALVLLSLMVPFVVTYVPNYLLLARWGLIGTMPGMILPMIGASLGFGIFLLRQTFLSFPKTVLEAALIDGATSWQLLWRVLAPANIAAITSVAIYILINTWNQFVWPLLIASGDETIYPLTVGVQMFFSNVEGGNTWGTLMAASVLASLPTILIYLTMRKAILKTFSEGAVKG